MVGVRTCDAGIIRTINPKLLKPNQCIDLENVDTNTLVLKSLKTHSLVIDASTLGTFIGPDYKVHDGNVVKFNGRFVSTSLIDNLLYVFTSISEEVSISTSPSSQHIIKGLRLFKNTNNFKNTSLPFVPVGITTEDVSFTTSASTSTADGDVEYAITLLDEFGTETNPFLLPKRLTTSTQSLTINAKLFFIGLPNKARLYRKSEGSAPGSTTQFVYISEVDIPATDIFWPDAGRFYADVALVDSSANLSTALPSTNKVLDTWSQIGPPLKLNLLTENLGTYFAAIDNTVVFSMAGDIRYWPPENLIKFDSKITALLPTRQGVLVCTSRRTELLTGTTANDLSRVLISDHIGCSENGSDILDDVPIWVSNRGVAIYTAGQVKIMSDLTLGPNIKLTFDKAFVSDNKFVIVNTNVNNKTFIFERGLGSKFYTYENSFLSNLTVDNGGRLLGVGPSHAIGIYHQPFDYDNSDIDVDTVDNIFLELKYKSPEFTEGAATVYKQFGSLFIDASGKFDVKVSIDGRNVLHEQIEGSKVYEYKLPSINCKGYYCQVEITGRGIVQEYRIDSVVIQ